MRWASCMLSVPVRENPRDRTSIGIMRWQWCRSILVSGLSMTAQPLRRSKSASVAMGSKSVGIGQRCYVLVGFGLGWERALCSRWGTIAIAV